MKSGDVVAGRFVIQAMAGSGGMGAVYRALDLQSDALVALKVLHGRCEPDEVEAVRFDREARLLAELRHPSIVRFVAHGQASSGHPFLAMEWLEGESLAARIKRTPLSVIESLALGRQVASALGEAHRRGIVHRDVKPANLHLCDGSIDRVRVLDFGIARLHGESAALTATGAMIGTPGYMAPEQARGERGLDARADVFSLGCVLFRCLAGRLPFEGDDVMSVLLKLVLDDSPRLSDLCEMPAAVDDLVARMLSKDPAGRPVDGDDVVRALDALPPLPAAATVAPARTVASEVVPISTQGPASITAGEALFVCLVLGRAPVATDDAPTTATPAHLGEGLARFGASLDMLADGTLLVRVPPTGPATDQAARAARAALALAAALHGGSVVLVAGRATSDRREVVGAVVERGARLLAEGRYGVRIDADAAALVERSFDIARDDGGLRLVAEHDVGGSARRLLGRPTPCVGRERELSLLESLYDEAVAESAPRAAVVTGAPGVGKSRLRMELLRRLNGHEPPPEVWIARADAMTSGSPFGLLGPMLRRVFGIVDGEPTDSARSKIRSRTAVRVDGADAERVTRLLGELMSVPFPDHDFPELALARRDPRIMREQMRAAFEEWVRAESVTPIVIALEDIHWADVPSMSFVEMLLARLEDRPLFVLGLARPALDEVFAKLWAERGALELRLGPLAKRASEELARAVLADKAAPDHIARVVELAAGNAFYLEELLRASAEGARELPTTVLAMVESRIANLDTDLRRVLRASSIFGGAAWPGGAAPLLGSSDASVVRTQMAELARREFLTERRQSRFSGEDEYTFRHALLRDAAYATLTSEDRALGHRLAGEWLASVGEKAIVVAEHFDRGGDTPRAITHYVAAATQALDRFDLAAALHISERAIVLGAEGEALADLRIVRGRAFFYKHALANAREELEVAAKLPMSDEKRGRLELQISHVAFWAMDVPSFERAAHRAHDLARSAGDRATWAEATATLAMSDYSAGEDRSACERIRRAREIDALTPSGQVVNGGFFYYLTGRLEEAKRHFDEYARIARTVCDPPGLMAFLMNHAVTLTALGRYGEAAALFAEARAIDEGTRLPVGARIAACEAGTFLDRFDLAKADQVSTEAREVARSRGFAPSVGSSTLNLVFVAVRRGEVARARTHLEEFAPMAEFPGMHRRIWAERLAAARAELALAEGALDEALTLSNEAISITAQRPKYAAIAHEVQALALARTGRTREAIAAQRRAVEVARGFGSPSSLLRAVTTLLDLDGDEALATEATALTERLEAALEDDDARRRFREAARFGAGSVGKSGR